MKLSTDFRLFLFVLLSVGLTSCSSNDQQSSANETALTLQVFNEDINTAIQQIDAVQAALDKLTDPEQADLQTAFKTYSNAVANMKTTEEKFLLHAEGMRVYGIEYFKAWKTTDEEAYQDPRLAKLSVQRRDSVKKVYEDITDFGIGLESDLRDFVSDITFIQNSLSSSLSKENIADLETSTQKVIAEGDAIADVMLQVQTVIKKAEAQMVP